MMDMSARRFFALFFKGKLAECELFKEKVYWHVKPLKIKVKTCLK